ncbi:pyridoxal 5'-phosphate synthase glutaminase subunit PdxT [bacterium]|nr:pyridoxal 5'-phosphate synthase glutaminase subunit PdxT [bacterium]
MKIGILSLQGAVSPHLDKLSELGVRGHWVKQPKDLEDLSGIILPGGESSTMLHLLRKAHLWEPLKLFVQKKPTWGICAGAILLAKEVVSPQQPSLEALDVRAVRNAYGRQTESFIERVKPSVQWMDAEPMEGVFIRAPRFETLGPQVKILFSLDSEPVMLQQGKTLASSFHPELTSANKFHQFFLKLCQESC